jgi:nicotinate-nucleotide adenylyltransferase
MTLPLRLGLFGGTFDPPHNGHVRLARAARAQLHLDQVLWIVAADPPHKRDQAISPVEKRLALVEAAVRTDPAFELSRVDVERPGPHYSADAVPIIARQHPGAQLVFLMGGDSLRDLPTWSRPLKLLEYCTLGVVRRPGAVIDLATLEIQIPGLTDKVAFIDLPPLDIASQRVRLRAQRGEPLADLVPPAVADVIMFYQLYRA